jgi:MFS family permease
MATNAGLWLFETALFWLVLKQTGSSTAVGLILTGLVLPLVVFAVPGGMLTDRFGPHRLMMISCIGWTLLVTVMAVVSATGPVTFPVALAAALLVGCFDSVWTIPGQVLVGRVVEPRHMANAIALSPLQFGIGRIVGGLSGGALVTAFGPTGTFLVASVMLLGGVLAMAGVREAEPHVVMPNLSVRAGEAVSWMLRKPAAIALVVLGACTALFGYSYLAVLPAVSRDLIHAGPNGLGMMTAAGGVGVILVALAGNSLGVRIGRGRIVPAALLVASAGLFLLAFSTSVALSVGLVSIIASMLILYTTTNSLVLQALTPRDLRGRVLAIWAVAYYASLPFGSVVAGNLADRSGTRAVLICLAALTAASTAAVVSGYRPMLRPDVVPVGAQAEVAAVGD